MAARSLRNYVGGEWCVPEGIEYLDVENPSTGEILARAPLTDRTETDRAVEAAQKAYAAWKDVPVSRRAEYMRKLLALMEEHEERICRTLVEEMGKSLPDARAEFKRAIENVEVACGMPILQQGDKVIGASFDIDGEVLRLPMGVFAMIAPFNFPAMVPFWFLPYAIASGNAFIVKASEQVPCTMTLIAELVERTGLPKGVFTLLHGGRAVGEALIEHPLVKGVSLVGASATCRDVARRCAEHNKRFQAMGGAKNHLVVMPDAGLDDAVRNMITSCFGCAGQRCMAASVIVCVGEGTYERVSRAFVEEARKIITTNPLDPAVAGESMVMGPVISAKAKDFILGMIGKGIDEGATLLLDGRSLSVPGYEGGHFVGATVLGEVKEGSSVHRTEIFGPVVAMMRAASLDEAIRIINDHPYGNGASIYTSSGYSARRFKVETLAGMIGVNVGIPAPVAYLPFGGMKASQWSSIKAQGKAVVSFFTQDKIVTERYWSEG